MNLYIITVETKHGNTDTIIVKTKPTHMDLGLIENYYLTEYNLENVHVEYREKLSIQDIPRSVTEWIEQY